MPLCPIRTGAGDRVVRPGVGAYRGPGVIVCRITPISAGPSALSAGVEGCQGVRRQVGARAWKGLEVLRCSVGKRWPVPAGERAPLEVVQAQGGSELPVIVLDAPSSFREADESLAGMSADRFEIQYFTVSASLWGHWARSARTVGSCRRGPASAATGMADSQQHEVRSHHGFRALAPGQGPAGAQERPGGAVSDRRPHWSAQSSSAFSFRACAAIAGYSSSSQARTASSC